MIIAREMTENGEVILREGPAGYEIIVDGQFLMSSASGDSSVALVKLGLGRLTGREHLQVLIGGLGLGFSLATALANPAVNKAVVVELEGKIIEWHRRGLITGQNAHIMDDPRTDIINQDFIQFLEERFQGEQPGSYDLIALDIDNGPDWLSHEANGRLYEQSYLQCLYEMVKPESVLTMWSAAPSETLKESLERVFGNVEEIEATDNNGEGKPIAAYIYVCKKIRKGKD